MIGAGVSDQAWAEILEARAETDQALIACGMTPPGGAS